MSFENHQNKCPICNAIIHDIRNIFSICPNCRVWIRNSPDYKSIDERYQDSWDSPEGNQLDTGATQKTLATIYINKLRQELHLFDFAGFTVLDFGAGRGEFAIQLIEKGARVFTFEPYGYTYLEERGIQVYKSLDEIPHGQLFDLIVNIDVIEHVINPIETISFFFSHINPGGYLFNATPNCQSLNARLTRMKWREAQNPGHLCLFSAKGLNQALGKAGFQNINRLRWIIDYSPKVIKKIYNIVMTYLALDGELRFLCQKPKQD